MKKKTALIKVKFLKKQTILKIFNNGNITKLWKRHKYTIFILEIDLGLKVLVVYIQKPFLGN